MTVDVSSGHSEPPISLGCAVTTTTSDPASWKFKPPSAKPAACVGAASASRRHGCGSPVSWLEPAPLHLGREDRLECVEVAAAPGIESLPRNRQARATAHHASSLASPSKDLGSR